MEKTKDAQPTLAAALRECTGGIALLVGFGAVVNLLYLTTPLYMMQLFDRVLASGRVETLVVLTAMAAFALAILGVLETVRGRLATRMSEWLDGALCASIIDAAVRATLAGNAPGGQGLRDLSTLRGFITGALRGVLDLPWTPLFVGCLWLLHPVFGVFSLVCALVLAAMAVLNELMARRPTRAAIDAQIDNERFTEQALRNADSLSAMGMVPRFAARWAIRNRRAIDGQRQVGDRAALMLGACRFVRLAAPMGILGLGAYLVVRNELSAGAMIAGSILLGRALAPLEQLIGAWRALVNAQAARARLGALFEAAAPGAADAMPLPAPEGALRCEEVWFVPSRDAEPVLRDIGFELPRGETLAIMGSSGAGKSTLCKLLIGSLPATRGSVRLDGAELASWPSAALGPYIGYLPQEVDIFPGTVKDNLSRLHPDPDSVSDAVVEAARAAGAHELIVSLPNGYDTPIGPGGLPLSGGQRQRIGLARALFGAPRLVILDEPNANLDGAGELALVDSLRELKARGTTVILVTHHTRMLETADKILLLASGRQGMFGPRQQVLDTLRPAAVPVVTPRADASEPAAIAQPA